MRPTLDDDQFPPLPSQKSSRLSKTRNSYKPKDSLPTISKSKLTLNELPVELLLQIIEYLPCHDIKSFNLPTILSLSLTSRRFNQLVRHYIYEEYNSFFGTPYLFLRTLISNPQAATEVRSLTLSYGPGVHEDRKPYNPSVIDRGEVKDSLKALDIPKWKAWATDCNNEETDQETLYAVILMHTPNVAFLDLDDGDVPYQTPKWIDVIKQSVGGNSFGRVHHFSYLKVLRVDIGTLRLRTLAPLFRLPALQRLILVGLVETAHAKPGKGLSFKWPVSRRSSPVEELLLSDCFMDPHILETIMETCLKLKSFQYEHRDERWYFRLGGGSTYWRDADAGQTETVEHHPVLCHYPTISTALLRHREKLESLQVFDGVDDDNQNYRGTSSLGSLRTLNRLKFLKGPIGAFADPNPGNCSSMIENLPASLEAFHLVIKWNDEEHACLPALEHMAINLRSHLPALQELRIKIDAPRRCIKFDWGRIVEPLRKFGVDIIVKQKESSLLWSEDSDDDTGSEDLTDTESENLDANEIFR